jgi:hypothetical protein
MEIFNIATCLTNIELHRVKNPHNKTHPIVLNKLKRIYGDMAITKTNLTELTIQAFTSI